MTAHNRHADPALLSAASITPGTAAPRARRMRRTRRADWCARLEGIHLAMLTILLIVLVVLLLTGGIGFGYRGRGRA